MAAPAPLCSAPTHVPSLPYHAYSCPKVLSSAFPSRTTRERNRPREVGLSPAPSSRAVVRCRCSSAEKIALPLQLESHGLCNFSLSLERRGFGRGFCGQSSNWGSIGTERSTNERSVHSRGVPLSAGRTNFLGKQEEEEEDPDETPLSKKLTGVPIIGQLPLTRKALARLTPMKLLVWAVLATLAYTLWSVITSATIFNPTFLNYSTWLLVKWPLPAAILVGISTLAIALRSAQAKRQPREWEQVVLLLGSLTWLILVPAGVFSGFVDGWPLILFVLYVGFFLISAIVRYRLHGDLESKDKDKQWESTPSRLWQVGFVASVVGGHWLAAAEAPFLYYSWNLHWKSILAVLTLGVAVVTHYSSSYFLGKYFDRLVRPQAVVMFGPYRMVRHPIYASYMLLFVGYCLALRSYKSLLFLLTACILYYEQRTKLEEDMLVEGFGETYESYRERVVNKYFPLLY